MEYLLHKAGNLIYLEITDTSFVLGDEQDSLNLAVLCVENFTTRLLLNVYNLPDFFFDLKTGLAGAVIQKFSTYRITYAAVVPVKKIAGRFREMVIETNRGDQFRFFTTKAEAEKWIEGDKLKSV